MKKNRIILLVLLTGLWSLNSFAQLSAVKFNWRNQNSKIEFQHKWSFGTGLNVVDDSADPFGFFKDPSEKGNFSFPIAIYTEYNISSVFSLSAAISSNTYSTGKVIDSKYIIDGDAKYIATDIFGRIYFRNFFKTVVFDPYIALGTGFTKVGSYKISGDMENPDEIIEVPATNRFTANAGFGFNFWFTKNWGANLNLTGKWVINKQEYTSNHKQYSLGLVYLM
jgi:hypothetical protein